MKGRLPSFIMVLVALALVFSMVATVAPSANVASAQTGGINSWVRHDLPTSLKYQMFPNSDIWDLTAADDGTLFALVEDTSGVVDMFDCAAAPPGPALNVWDGLRWAVFPAYSDIALMKSTDGGYTWTIMWHQPSSDVGAPIAVVPQPGYVDGDSANSAVFVATGTRYVAPGGPLIVGGMQEGNIYRSFDGGKTFTRVTPRNPAVTLVAGGTITSMDVAENTDYPGTFMALVGVSSLQAGGPGANVGEGVYTWNEDNDRDWRDKQVSTALPPAPFPGTMPAGNGIDVWAVKASPTYTEDQILMAVVSDLGTGPGSPGSGIYLCLWDGMDGAWGGDVDSPTNGRIGVAGLYTYSAVIEVADDFSNANNVFVGIDSTGQVPGGADDVWRIVGRSTVTGPSLVQARGLIPAAPAGQVIGRISDMQFIGSAATGSLYVGCEAPFGVTAPPVISDGQAQVFRGESLTLWPTWAPAFKPPSGAWPVSVDLMGEKLMVAGGGDGFTTGGVHRCAAGCMACAAGQRMVFNGVGLMDDIAVSQDIPGYVNPGAWPTGVPLMNTLSWCLAEAVAEEISPTLASDGLMYVSTFSEWNHNDIGPVHTRPQMAELSLWRWTDSMHWERILYEHLTMPVDGPGPGAPAPGAPALYAQYRGKPMLTVSGQGFFYNDWTWWPQVSDAFSDEDPYVFLLGGRGDSIGGGAIDLWVQEMLWYSPDLGDTWINVLQMPLGAYNLAAVPAQVYPAGVGMSETGWHVETNQVVFMGDIAGRVYKTTNRGGAWTEGVWTALGLEIYDIETSPIYSETGESDKVVLVGTYDGVPRDTHLAPPLFAPIPNVNNPGLAASDFKNEVWISQDGCESDLLIVGAEINTDPGWSGHETALTNPLQSFGGAVVNFDKGWETNGMVYSAAGGWMDRWQLVGLGATVLTRIDTTDVGLYRTKINPSDPSASTWSQLWDADDFMDVTRDPQPLLNMIPTDNTYRSVFITDLQVAQDGTLYVPFGIWDMSYNAHANGDTPNPPSPQPWDNVFGGNLYGDNGYGRFTNGGVLRTLDGTQKDVEILSVRDGLGEWDGLYLNRAVPGSNILISLAWDWQEWRFKLAILEDTLSTTATSSAPASGATGVGTLADNKVSVQLTFGALDADVYEWQVDDDCGFVPPLVASGVTSEELVTVTNLEPDVSYCWRVRATEPYWSRWSAPAQFQTVIGAELVAPKLLAPAAGATIMESRPSFQWTAIGWADKYSVQVATSSAFGSADMVVNENLGDIQAYQPGSDMADGTYFWRVKASSSTSSTAWSSTGSFTIASEGADGGGTSAWVWVLIIVGILLIILILVLIMRTRRPA